MTRGIYAKYHYKSCYYLYYTTTGEISAILLAWSSGISASFEIPTCENYKPFAGSGINK